MISNTNSSVGLYDTTTKFSPFLWPYYLLGHISTTLIDTNVGSHRPLTLSHITYSSHQTWTCLWALKPILVPGIRPSHFSLIDCTFLFLSQDLLLVDKHWQRMCREIHTNKYGKFYRELKFLPLSKSTVKDWKAPWIWHFWIQTTQGTLVRSRRRDLQR